MTDLDDILSLEEAAELAGKSPEALRKAAQRGSLDAKQLGRQWATTREAVASWLAWTPVNRRNAKGRYERGP